MAEPSDSPGRRIDAGIALYRQGAFGAALAAVDGLLQGGAANVDALNLAAACALALGQPGGGSAAGSPTGWSAMRMPNRFIDGEWIVVPRL